MPTIKARKQANGSTRYTAIVRIRRGTTVLHQESRTFTHRTAALSWARHREVALEEPAALIRQRHGAPTLADLIHWYIETFEKISRWQRSKQTHLEFLERHSLLNRLREHFKSRDRRATIPMEAILDFAIASARRESEICRLEWRDNDKTTWTGMARDAKHPTAEDGNHRRFKYTPEAWALVTAQPQTSEACSGTETRWNL